MSLLAQFLLRLTFGLAVGMGITSSRLVTSGYFRNNLYVTLGLSVGAAVVTYATKPGAFWYAVAAAVTSYIGAVCWLYEKPEYGKTALLFVALTTIVASLELLPSSDSELEYLDRYHVTSPRELTAADVAEDTARSMRMGNLMGVLMLVANISAGLLLGITTAAMLLGHWYLNSPTMELAPLRKLILAMGAAVALQAAVSAAGLACELNYAPDFSAQWLLFVVLRWSFGILGVAVLAWMAWETLKVPNTQSATGILYVAVIGVFVGELTAQLLSAESAFPL